MTIRKLLFRYSLLITALLGLAIAGQLILDRVQNKELQTKAVSDQIAHEVAALVLLTSEWPVFHYERIYQQWEIKNNQVKELINQNNPDYNVLREDLAVLEARFKELMETRGDLGKDFPIDQMHLLTEKQERLVTQNQVVSQGIIDKTFEISENAMARFEKLQDLSSLGLILFLLLVAVVIFNASGKLIKRITVPIEKLQSRVLEFEKRDYKNGINHEEEQNYLKNTTDTLILGRAINSMLQAIQSSVAELRTQNTYIRTILDNIPLGVAVNKLDGAGEVTYINQQFQNIYGWPGEVLTDQAVFFEKVYPDPNYRHHIKERILNDIGSRDPEKMRWGNVEITTQDGVKRRVDAQNIPLFEQNLMISTVLDVTKQKQAEHQLIHSEQRYRNLFMNSPDAIFINLNDKIVLANKAFLYLMKAQNMKEVIGKTPYDVFHPGCHEKIKDRIYAVRELGEKIPYFEEKIVNLEGEATDVEVHRSGFLMEEDKAIHVILHDVTERINREREIEKNQTSLKQLTTELTLIEEKQRKEIAGNIHDHLSQSLVISKMKLNDLIMDPSTKSDTQKLESIKNHISDALENSRNITYDLSPPILYELGLVETMYWLIEKTEREHDLAIDFQTDFEKTDLPETDLILVYRSVQEVIYNIIKHARATEVNVLFQNKNGGVNIVIRDNGRGFDVTYLKAKQERGKSFGLFAVQERIENMGGQFTLDSKPGSGTTVEFLLPFAINSDADGNKNITG
ncbi:PAS domain-containing sensor histidine kinase [Marinilabilia rubra]|uniref:Oxygen sensor histidine kinase NreB n=1 Tax=Marinilabilia rubra TaxID=2162893 RepID=A0A2U2BBN1_9BACT|nr:PAS domain-containing sensor histidine kinase [Marinilabilia rubra]PWE00484.1 hypothetical protein DDZ16_06025 [Marinilabilia rubra]